ncbi:MAG: hypothetical protein GXP21_06525 [Gammaproteobacteria bacterium]|nr:hypothetical protein [Gammaproteobacteria bacterium]
MNNLEISHLLATNRELAVLCSQNGWIDSATLSYDLIEQSDNSVKLKVRFDEIVMEGSGCVAARISCYGYVDIDYSSGVDQALITATK